MKTGSFENFLWWMVLTCNAVGVAIYAIGLFLMARLGVVWGALFAAYCIWMEWRLLSGSCRSCYYFGKRCGFGRGRLCSWFFAQGSGTEPGRKTNLVVGRCAGFPGFAHSSRCRDRGSGPGFLVGRLATGDCAGRPRFRGDWFCAGATGL